MSDPIDKALALWGLDGADCEFVADRENRVYRVRSQAGDYALRFKRPHYRSDAELHSELLWLEAMHAAGLHVPQPKPTLCGDLLATIDGRRFDLIGWLAGKPLGHSREALDLTDAVGVFYRVGQTMAQLHQACDAWQPPNGFTRCHWNIDGLLGEAPLWDRFWDNPKLDAEQRGLLCQFRATARRDLQARHPSLDYGLIHADFVRENILIDGSTIRILDFDDGGFGYRLFDVATALIKNRQEPNYLALQTSLIAGYQSKRSLDTAALDLFMALRSVTYVGWIIQRMDAHEATDRSRRFIDDACELCERFLAMAPNV